MGSRLELHEELLGFVDNVYFQPPSSISMNYPCIVYKKDDKSSERANDGIYLSTQGYELTLIERNPDSPVADSIHRRFKHCSIGPYYTADNLNHTTLTLFY